MTNRTPHPTDTLTNPHDLAYRLGCPIAVTDYQVTRRQRVHLLYLPGDRHHFVAADLEELIREAAAHGHDRLVLTHDPYAQRATGRTLRFGHPFHLRIDPSLIPGIT